MFRFSPATYSASVVDTRKGVAVEVTTLEELLPVGRLPRCPRTDSDSPSKIPVFPRLHLNYIDQA
jgi:hypothetical protein